MESIASADALVTNGNSKSVNSDSCDGEQSPTKGFTPNSNGNVSEDKEVARTNGLVLNEIVERHREEEKAFTYYLTPQRQKFIAEVQAKVEALPEPSDEFEFDPFESIPTSEKVEPFWSFKESTWVDERGWYRLNRLENGRALSPDHADELADSGIDPWMALRAGIRTANHAELRKYGYWGEEEHEEIAKRLKAKDRKLYKRIRPHLTNSKGERVSFNRWASKCRKLTDFQVLGDGPGCVKETREYLLYEYYDPWGARMQWTCPIRNKTYPYARIKLPGWARKDNPKYKYHQPAKSPVRVYIPSLLNRKYGTMLGLDELGDIKHIERQEIRFTEGEKKALCSYLHTGTLTVGLGGVWSFKAPYVLEYVSQALKTQILFDNDIWTNHRIKAAIEGFGEWINTGLKLKIAERHIKSKLANNPPEKELEDLIEQLDNIQASLDGLKIKPSPGIEPKFWEKLTPDKYAAVIEKLGYSLLPLSLKREPDGKQKKLGIDDWLIGENQVGSAISEKILGINMPIYQGDGQFRASLDPWMDSEWKAKLALRVGGHSYNWLEGKWESEEDKDSKDDKKNKPKLSFKTFTSTIKAKSRDLAASLVLATAAMGKVAIQHNTKTSYAWNEGKQIWENRISENLRAELLGIALDKYKFNDGNSTLDKVIMSQSFLRLSREIYSGEYVGVAGADLHKGTGEVSPISPDNWVFGRTQYSLSKEKPTKFIQNLVELFGDEETVELFRAMVRLSYAPMSMKPQAFYPVIVGESGCGKSTLFEVLSKVLPGCESVDFKSVLSTNNAMGEYLPESWYGASLIFDQEFKFSGTVSATVISILNKLSDGHKVAFRSMGKQMTEQQASFRAPWLLANKRPRMNTTDSKGSSRRFLTLYCERKELESANINWRAEILEEEGNKILGWIMSVPVEEANEIVRTALKSPEHDEDILESKLSEYRDVVAWLADVADPRHSPREHEFKDGSGRWIAGFERGEVLSWLEKPGKEGYKEGRERQFLVHGPHAHSRYLGWAEDNCKRLNFNVRGQAESFYQAIEELGGFAIRSKGKLKKIRIPKGWERPSTYPPNMVHVKVIALPLGLLKESGMDLEEYGL